MELILQPQQIAYPLGLAISVQGFKGDVGGRITSQVFLEVYEGKLRVHVWDGGEDPNSTILIDRVEACPPATEIGTRS